MNKGELFYVFYAKINILKEYRTNYLKYINYVDLHVTEILWCNILFSCISFSEYLINNNCTKKYFYI